MVACRRMRLIAAEIPAFAGMEEGEIPARARISYFALLAISDFLVVRFWDFSTQTPIKHGFYIRAKPSTLSALRMHKVRRFFGSVVQLVGNFPAIIAETFVANAVCGV